MNRLLIVLLMIASLNACGKKETYIKKYYFPYARFITPQIYQYVDRKDTNLMMYWYFNTTVEKGDTILTTCIFDAKFRPANIYQNTISATGCSLKEMLINLGDSTAMTKCQVKEKDVFNWQIKPKEKLVVSFSISNSDGSESENVITERSFDPKKQYVDFNGKEYECIVAKDLVLLNHIKTNRTLSEEQNRTSYFAEGIGLIEFETLNANGSSTYFVLKRIINKEEWNKMILSTPDSSGTANR